MVPTQSLALLPLLVEAKVMTVEQTLDWLVMVGLVAVEQHFQALLDQALGVQVIPLL